MTLTIKSNICIGYMTSKGELIRAILYPKPLQFRFYTDLVKVTCVFLIFGVAGLIFTTYSYIKNGVLRQNLHVWKVFTSKLNILLLQGSPEEVILNALDIVTVVIPPILPAALTAATAFAQRRLKTKQIFCLSAKHITLCGGVDVICFDKVFWFIVCYSKT